MRRVVAALAVALVAAACSDGALEPPELLSPAPVESQAPADGSAETTDDQPGGAPVSEQAQAPASEQAAPPADEEPAPAEQPPSEQAGPALTEVVDGGPVGANAAAYLRGDRPRVVLEVDVQDGARLPDGVLDHVRAVLDRESASAVEVVRGAATTTRRDAWTADQLRAAAAETRSTAHSDEVAVLHLLVLRDGYEDDGVLGLAFGSSSAVVFPDQWSDLTTALLSGDRIARAVATHEVGHLLGLVGLYEAPTSDHEDPDHPGHTRDPDDVMYYAVERSVISQLDGIPTDFGPATRADLAAIREG